MPHVEGLPRGQSLWREIRIAAIRQGTSAEAVCREMGVASQNARRAAYGEWDGPKAREVLAELLTRVRLQPHRLRANREATA